VGGARQKSQWCTKRSEVRNNLLTRRRVFEPFVASVIYFSPKVDRLCRFAERVERRHEILMRMETRVLV
jgi:hypothetical protein